MSDLTEWLCTECGRKHEFSTYGPKECLDCGAFLKRANEVPLVANEEIESIVSGMRGTAQGAENDDNGDCATVLRSYADELEGLIDE